MKRTATLVCLCIGLFFTISAGNASPLYSGGFVNTFKGINSLTLKSNAASKKDDGLRIFPDASADILNIQRKNADQDAILKIIDQSGNVIVSENIAAGTLKYGLQLSTLKSGAYTIQLIGKNSTETKKFMML